MPGHVVTLIIERRWTRRGSTPAPEFRVKTVKTVLSREGIDPAFADQMPEFDGRS